MTLEQMQKAKFDKTRWLEEYVSFAKTTLIQRYNSDYNIRKELAVTYWHTSRQDYKYANAHFVNILKNSMVNLLSEVTD